MATTYAKTKLKLPWVDRLEVFLRSRAIRLVILALVANTIMAQAFFNSAGRILILFGHDLTAGYLNVSAILSTLAFSFFEIAMLWARQEVLSLDESIKTAIHAEKWLRRNMATLVVITGINFYCLTVFNAAIWPSITVPGIPEPSSPFRFYLHAAFYSVILYLAGMVGERVKTEQELTMTMARKHSQHALEAHDQQVMQQIRDMTARGDTLAPLAAATSSPETAQLIAVQHAVLSGALSVADAARFNMQSKQHDTTLLDKVAGHVVVPPVTVPVVPAVVLASPVVTDPPVVAVVGRDDNDEREAERDEPGRVRFDDTRRDNLDAWLGVEAD